MRDAAKVMLPLMIFAGLDLSLSAYRR